MSKLHSPIRLQVRRLVVVVVVVVVIIIIIIIIIIMPAAQKKLWEFYFFRVSKENRQKGAQSICRVSACLLVSMQHACRIKQNALSSTILVKIGQ
jgi:energy-coupling factor transporter transmembrane protein EcfT